MKLFFSAVLLILCSGVAERAIAQNVIRARTDAGREVILFPDGTWKYGSQIKAPPEGISVIAPVIKPPPPPKPQPTRKLYKPQRGNFGVWYDESKWQLSRRPNATDPNSQMFMLRGGDGYAVVITEELGIPMTALKRIALENAKTAASDAKIVFEEQRTVNGREVLCLKLTGTIEGIPFQYYGYYYGGKAGTIQVLTFTGESIFGKYEAEFTEFLNGLEIYE